MTEPHRLEPPGEEDLALAIRGWVGGQLRTTVPQGQGYFRTVWAEGSDRALTYAQELFPSPREGRFTPLRDFKSEIVPVAYCAETEDVSLWEAVLRTITHRQVRRVPATESRERYLVGVKTLHPLELIDLRRPKLYALAREDRRAPDLSGAWDSQYVTTQRWAQTLYGELTNISLRDASVPNADGLLYESHQVPGTCLLLWREAPEPEKRRVFAATGAPQPVWHNPIREKLIRMALQAGAAIDFDDDPEN